MGMILRKSNENEIEKIVEISKKSFDTDILVGGKEYVLSLDRFDYSRDGIAHLNIVDFLLGKIDIILN